MPSDVREVVEALPSAFLPEKAGSTRAVFQLNMTGDDGGQWVMEVADGQCHVQEGTAARQPDVTLTMAGEDFVALSNNELDAVRAFMAGKIKVSGNAGLVMQLLNWFDRGKPA
jgi:putative sterol carrier protein